MKKILSFLGVLVILFSVRTASAQCSPTLLPDSAQYVTDGAVRVMVQRGNSLYMGGNFNYVGRPTGSFIGVTPGNALVNQATWPKLNGIVYCAVPDGAGGWIVGGNFTRAGDSVRRNLVQIGASGNVTSWNPAPDSTVFCMEISGGNLYFGGLFGKVGTPGVTRNRAAMVSLASGTLGTWNPNANDVVNAIAINGSLAYIGGAFTNVGGIGRNRLAAVDLSAGSATSWNPSADGKVNSLLVKGSKVYVAGAFTAIGALTRNRLAAVSTATGLATSWNPNVSAEVKSIAIASNLLYLGGNFSSVGGLSRTRIAAVDTNTGVPTSWAPVMGGRINAVVTDGTTVYAGGDFNTVGATPVWQFARLSATTGALVGDVLAMPDGATQSQIYTLVRSGSNIFIGGNIYSAGGVRKKNFLVVDLISDTIVPFNLNSDGPINSFLFNGSNIILGGDFNNVNGVLRDCLASVDSTGTVLSWNPLAISGIAMTKVSALAINGSSIYIGGAFTFPGHRHLVRADLISGAIDPWSPDYNYTVNCLLINSGNLFVGRSYGASSTLSYLITYNASTDALLTNLPLNSNVLSFHAVPGSVFAGGDFYTLSSASQRYALKMNASTGTTVSWSAPIGSPPSVTSILAMASAGSNLFIGGSFSTIGSVSHKGIAMLNTTTAAVSSWDPQMQGGVSAMYSTNNNLWVSGSFDGIDGGRRLKGFAKFRLSAASVSVSIAASGGDTSCAGASKTLTATTSGPVLSYQWRVNGINVGSGASSYVYTPANGDTISCKVTISACAGVDSVISNTRTMTVLPNIAILTSATKSSDTVCAGDTVTYVAHGIPGLHYQWKRNTVSVGTDDSTYRYAPATGDSVYCIVTAPPGGCYIANPVTSIKLRVVALPDTIPVITITGDTAMCAGAVSLLTSSSNVPAGTIKWLVNGVMPAGATSSTYTFTPSDGDMVVGVLAVPLTGCYSAPNDTSNFVTMDVTPNVVPVTTITADATTVCAGAGISATQSTTIAGGTYEWQVNGTAVATSAGYSYTPADGDILRCIVTAPTGGCYTPSVDTSNTLLLNVTPLTMPSISLSGPSDPMAAGGSVTVTATVSDAGTAHQITWYNNGALFATTTVDEVVYTKSAGAIDTITARVTSLSSGCYDTAVSVPVYVYATTAVGDVTVGSSITLYPNPFVNQVTLSGVPPGARVNVFDMVGREVPGSAQFVGSDVVVSLKVSVPGFYVFRVYNVDGLVIGTFPMVKQM
ncbi:MAG: hypothetical protein KF744_06130 [Taibaiella sp.]|nr:hypothetical protein [Taibaiella sp.]